MGTPNGTWREVAVPVLPKIEFAGDCEPIYGAIEPQIHKPHAPRIAIIAIVQVITEIHERLSSRPVRDVHSHNRVRLRNPRTLTQTRTSARKWGSDIQAQSRADSGVLNMHPAVA